MPIFDTTAGLHVLQFSSNTGYTPDNNVVQKYHWGIPYQLHINEEKIINMFFQLNIKGKENTANMVA